MAERVIDRLEVVEVEAEHRSRLVAADAGQALFHLFAEENAVRQAGQGIVMRDEGDPLLGALPLGDVDGADQRGLHAFIGQQAGIDRDVDRLAVRLPVPPGEADLALELARQSLCLDLLGMTEIGERHRQEFGA